jgi:hypothetical protein
MPLTIDDVARLSVSELVEHAKEPAAFADTGFSFRFGFLVGSLRRYLLKPRSAAAENALRATLLAVMGPDDVADFLALEKIAIESAIHGKAVR